jgi:hypothetical protein
VSHIQTTLNALLCHPHAPIQLFHEDSDDYDSDGVPDEPTLSSELTEPVWEWDAPPAQAIVPRPQHASEAAALEAFNQGFAYGDYAPQLIHQLSKQLLEFLTTTMEKVAESAFDHELLSFLAVSSMDFHAKAFKAPGLLAQDHSALIYYFQLVLIEYSSQLPDGRSQRIRTFMQEYFNNHSFSGLADLLTHRALAMDISKQSSGTYNDVVPLPGESISFQQITVSVHDLGRFFQRLVGIATTILVEHLLI